MATSTLTPAEEAQLAQTIEMFEVIAQSQPNDFQSLEILKEAYSKLGRERDVIQTSKRIAQSYVDMGQLSSAILEYETILQRAPGDPDIEAALKEIESKASNFPTEPGDTVFRRTGNGDTSQWDTTRFIKPAAKQNVNGAVEDGRRPMQKLYVEGRLISQADFDRYWPKADMVMPPTATIEPFIHTLSEKGLVPVEKSLKLLCDHSRVAYLPLNSYDIDMDLARTFPAATCQRWCVLPFDRMSKSILVATVNPYNQQAAKELAKATPNRLLWYVVPPADLLKTLRKAFR